MALDPNSWLKQNLTWMNFGNIILPDTSWLFVFTSILWWIWKTCNVFIFRNIIANPRVIAFRVKLLASDLASDLARAFPCLRSRLHNTADVCWKKPQSGWCKLNTDASLYQNTTSAAMGGLVRDGEGRWMYGFSMKLGTVSINLAELMALREGLKLSSERQHQKIEVEVDSEVVFKWVQLEDTADHPYAALLKDCRDLLRLPWEIVLRHTKRGGNQCADGLAKLGHNLTGGLHIWETPPVGIVDRLKSEAMEL
ncbi:hypothetical protein OROGR_013404 [Orobanche gracilis]